MKAEVSITSTCNTYNFYLRKEMLGVSFVIKYEDGQEIASDIKVDMELMYHKRMIIHEIEKYFKGEFTIVRH